MARYIDADALFIHGAVPFIANDGFATAEKVKEIIAKAPTVDAVEVVRCKDCRYRIYEKVIEEWFCNCSPSMFVYAKPNDFCPYGERRTDEDNT